MNKKLEKLKASRLSNTDVSKYSGPDSISNNLASYYAAESRSTIPGSVPFIADRQTTTSTTTTTTTVAPAPFISVWRTTSPDESITLPYFSGGSYNGTIDWGDGNTSVNSYDNRTHTYANAGDYTVTISGRIRGWSFSTTLNIEGNNAKITSVSQWGDGFTLLVSFENCSNLDLSNVVDVVNLSYNTNLQFVFKDCTSLTTINRLNEWDVSDMVSLSGMFQGATSFNQNIGNWNVSSVNSGLDYMFKNATSFNNGGSSDINNWNVSNVTNMRQMFQGATSFNQDISSWDVSNAAYMDSMFNGASAFNQDLSGWCVTLISSEPTDFATGATAWVLPKPVWGTCP